jgi:hypothetical protein
VAEQDGTGHKLICPLSLPQRTEQYRERDDGWEQQNGGKMNKDGR